MNDHMLPAVLHALDVYENRDGAERGELAFEAAALTQYGVFSNSNLSLITGLRVGLVHAATGKQDHTGGRLNPESLPLVAEYIQRERRSPALAVKAMEAGISPGMFSRLTGSPLTTVSRWRREARRHDRESDPRQQ